jgi:hypothetical protein
MHDSARARFIRIAALHLLIAAGVMSQARAGAQDQPAAQAPAAQSSNTTQTPIPPGVRPIAIIPLDSKVRGHAAEVTGALLVNDGRAFVAANASVTAGEETAQITLPYRGTLLVCASTNVKLTADASNAANGIPGLMMAMDHGAVELSYAGTAANLQSADVLLTPDFRILIGGPGAADVKVRLGQQGDTCVDNSGANGPYVVVSSVFEGGTYRVQPGQRVSFQHGSLHEVVDQEKESCGCPPSATKGNEFPVAQSMGLSPTPTVPQPPAVNNQAQAQTVPPLVYQTKDKVPVAEIPAQPAPQSGAPAVAAQPKPKSASPKRGFFGSIGHFFRRIFGADE